jgi:hypothetical protein
MNRITIRSRVDSDGVLRVSVPLGRADADREVEVTVAPAPGGAQTEREYADWVDSLAGRWQGDFERPPQGEYEQREPL